MNAGTESLFSARRNGELDELGAAFKAWRDGHGVVWFDTDRNLAQAIAEVLGLMLHFESDDDA